ncbi:MAG: tetratricopeptide repeat protein [Anaerolineales bacterium]|nr:tetratricopeptide repeat protein [Anaerolineales bacterium]
MAKVSLRIYNRDIESLIDQGGLDEAIAHCRHILKTFPKHLDTYRLLGKAYLEAKRYTEAVDIFQRVLMAAPDDFVSHVGMSIIRDDEEKLDDAIWHMERAFESQPSNGAIQAELQRLYGRRDGVEPPKIRLTRGALAHMYVQGELYSQAIAEIRSVLAEDPNRTDMQVLLARSYYHSGQKVESSEICSVLLKRYPYNLDANCLLTEILRTTETIENTQAYRHRVIELEPYAAFVKGTVFQHAEVADAAVNLERLDYQPGDEVEMVSDWDTSLGIRLDKGGRDQKPAWLEAAADDAPAGAGAAPAGDADIPGWLRGAGWGEATGAAQEGPMTYTDSEDPEAGGGIAPADIPDWVKAMAPPGADIESTDDQGMGGTEGTDAAVPADMPDWIQDLGPGAGGPEQGAEEDQALPDWLPGLEGGEPEAAPAVDQVGSFSEGEAEIDQDLPDWLSGSQEEEPAETPVVQQAEPPVEAGGAGDGQELPDWLSGLEGGGQESGFLEAGASDAVEADDLPDWLAPGAPASGDAGVTFQPEPLESEPMGLTESEPEEKLPEQPEKPEPSLEDLGKTLGEQDDAMAWLENLAAKQGAKSEELLTDPNSRTENAPDWVDKARQLGGAQPQPLQAAPAAEVEPALDGDAFDEDETSAWLKGLEERETKGMSGLAEGLQADVPESSPTVPAAQDRGEEAVPGWLNEMGGAPAENKASVGPVSTGELPDWLQGAGSEEQPPAARADQPPVDETPVDDTDLPDWLHDADTEAAPQPAAAEEAEPIDSTDLPEWLQDVETGSGEPPAEIPEAVEPEQAIKPLPEPTPSGGLDPGNLPDWLENLETPEQGAEFTAQEPPIMEPGKVPEPEIEPEPEPEPLQPAEPAAGTGDDLPDWLQNLDEPVGEPAAPQSAVEDTSLPTQQEASTEPAAGDTGDLSSWLEGLDQTEEDEPAPAAPVESFPAAPQGMEKPEAAPEEAAAEPSVPEWLRDEESSKLPESSPAVTQPTSPEEWLPVSEIEDKPTAGPVAEVPQEAPPVVEPSAPAPARPAAVPELQKKGDLSASSDPDLGNAQAALGKGDITAALEEYARLVKKGRMLDEVIFDLREALYRYPVEVPIWQALGDAYMRANRLQDALDAYTKAEELLR